MRKKKVLITGSKGQLGSEFVEYILHSKWSVDAATSHDLNITDSKQVKIYLDQSKPDVIINTAAYTKVDLAESEPEKAYAVNAEAVQLLAAESWKRGIKLVHFSTDYVFEGSKSDKDSFPNGYTEQHPVHPQSVYGASKAEGERLALAENKDVLILRVAWLCGFYGHNFVKTMLRLGKEKNQLTVVADQFGAPSFAANVVQNTFALLYESGIFHLASTGLTSWHGLASKVMEIAKLPCDVQPIPTEAWPTPAKRPYYSKLDCTKSLRVPAVELEPWETQLERLVALLVHVHGNNRT